MSTAESFMTLEELRQQIQGINKSTDDVEEWKELPTGAASL